MDVERGRRHQLRDLDPGDEQPGVGLILLELVDERQRAGGVGAEQDVEAGRALHVAAVRRVFQPRLGQRDQ